MKNKNVDSISPIFLFICKSRDVSDYNNIGIYNYFTYCIIK